MISVNRRLTVYTIAATTVLLPGMALAAFTASRSNASNQVGAGSLAAPAQASVGTSAVSATNVTINVNAAPATGFTPTGYKVTRTAPTTGNVCTITATNGVGSCRDTSPVAGQNNYYAITSVLSGTAWTSLSAATATASVATAGVATPAAPTLLAADDSGASNADGITKTTKPHYTGSGTTANATVTLYANGLNVGTTTASGTGTYSVLPASALADGSYTITVTQTVGGVESNKSPVAAQKLVIDTAAPSGLTVGCSFASGSSGHWSCSGIPGAAANDNSTLTLTLTQGSTVVATDIVSPVGSLWNAAYNDTTGGAAISRVSTTPKISQSDAAGNSTTVTGNNFS